MTRTLVMGFTCRNVQQVFDGEQRRSEMAKLALIDAKEYSGC